ncbi:MAG: PaaI family thioesterase [Clostridia bacterium]|nr:PaaI family thioesterase [Clostridia bacterium]
MTKEEMYTFMEGQVEDANVRQKDVINGMLKGRLVDCDPETNRLVMEFPILPWEGNRVGVMHGGAITAVFDLAMGNMARYVAQANWAPTVGIEVKFVRPGQVGDTLVVTVDAKAAGKRITQLYAEAVSSKTGKLISTATSVYMNIDTMKEKGL